jgi:hypothetical protein
MLELNTASMHDLYVTPSLVFMTISGYDDFGQSQTVSIVNITILSINLAKHEVV